MHVSCDSSIWMLLPRDGLQKHFDTPNGFVLQADCFEISTAVIFRCLSQGYCSLLAHPSPLASLGPPNQ